MSGVRSTAASAEFNLLEMTVVETGGDPYYVLWKDGDVLARGALDTMKRSIRAEALSRDRPDPNVPRDWEPPGYENV